MRNIVLFLSMNFFSKKERPVENIAFIGIISAITIIFVSLLSLFSFLTYALALFLPLFATLVAVFCKKRYFPVYVLVTVLICSLLFFNRIELTLFTLIPSLIAGFLFGYFFDNQMSIPLLIVLTTIIQTLFSLLSLCIGGLLVGKGFSYSYIFTTLGLDGFDNIDTIFLPILLLFSLAQISLSLIIAYNEAKKFIEIKVNNKYDDIILASLIIFFTILLVIVSFFALPLSYLFMVINLLIGVFIAIKTFIENKVFIRVLIGFSLILSVFLFAGFFTLVNENASYLLLNNFPLLMAILQYVILLLSKNNKLDRIKNRTDK